VAEFWTTARQMPVPRRPPRRAFPVHEGKVVIVTGAAGGVGHATVSLLVSEGAKVVAWDVREDPLRQLTAQFTEDQVRPVVCDLGDQASIERAFEISESFFGRVNGLVNNAALSRRNEPLDVTWSDWHDCMAVNVYGAFEASRLAVRSMVRHGISGAIVNVSSEAGKKGHTVSIPYSASKAALISMTRVFAAGVAPLDINVNCICPGGIATDMLRSVAARYANLSGATVDEVFSQLVSSQMKRHIMPEEVARIISFFLSDDALIIRGQAVNTDGGDTPY
jgi:NAD(P)-dependent dehydrogenase (short-subunit alcohol dehydrogenase family)